MVDAIANVVTTLDYVENKIRSLRSRFEKAARNPEQVENLVNILSQVSKELCLLKAECQKQQQGTTANVMYIVQGRVRLLEAKAQGMKQKAEEIESVLNKGGSWKQKVTAFRKAKSVSEYVSGAQRCVEEMKKQVLDLFRCLQNNSTSTAVGAFAEEMGMMNVFSRQNMGGQNVCDVEFQPSFYNEPNPSFVVLRYDGCGGQSSEGISKETLEFQLKTAILSKKSGKSVAAVGSQPQRGVSVIGMGGVGKTCALRGLGTDKDIQACFPGGVYWLRLGKDVTKKGVMEQIQQLVLDTGGMKSAVRMTDEKTLKRTVMIARQWFEGQQILLLADDIWASSQIGSGAVQLLSKIVDASGGSRLAFTTRDLSVVSDSEIINFSPRSKGDARLMLMEAAGNPDEKYGPSADVIDSLLDICGGLPLTLATVGNTIRKRCCKLSTEEWTHEWTRYLRILKNQKGKLLKLISYEHYQYLDLAASFEASLSVLEDARCIADGEVTDGSQLSLRKSYESLVVLKRQEAVPVRVLVKLWNAGSCEDAEEIAQLFFDCSLAEQRTVVEDGISSVAITLHDLQLDFVNFCLSTDGVREVHRDLVNSWVPERSGAEYSMPGPLRSWASEFVLGDVWIRTNLFWYLLQAQLAPEMVHVLCDLRWMTTKLWKRELPSLIDDFEMVFSQPKKKVTANLRQPGKSVLLTYEDLESLRFLLRVAKSCYSSAVEQLDELWFQLFARLIRYAPHSKHIAQIINSFDEVAIKPWAKPIKYTLPMLDSRLISVIPIRGTVQGIVTDPEGEGFHCFVTNGTSALACVLREGRAENDVWMSGPETSINLDVMEPSHSGSIGSERSTRTLRRWSNVLQTAMSRDGSRIATGHGNGKVRIWDRRTGNLLCKGQSSGKAKIKCLCWSTDRTRLVSGHVAGAIKLWVINGSSMQCHDIGCDGNGPISLTWHPCKDLIASATGSKIIKIWNVESGKGAPRSIDLGITGAGILLVKWSPDGFRLATGCVGGFVKVWDERSEQITFSAEQDNMWSPERSWLETGDNSMLVKVWDERSEQTPFSAAEGGNSWVTCLSWSSEGQKIASGGSDKWIRVWDVGSGRQVFEIDSGHTQVIRCLAWSSGSSQLATVSKGDVKIWNTAGENTTECTWTLSSILRPSRLGLMGGHFLSASAEGGERRQAKPLARCMCAELSPDERWMALGFEDGSVQIWSVSNGDRLVHTFVGENFVICLRWSRDGRYVASGRADGSLRIWNIQERREVGDTLSGHSTWVGCIAWSPCGQRVVTDGPDGLLIVWNVFSGEAVISGPQSGHVNAEICCVEWALDGTQIYSGGRDGVRVWNAENLLAVQEILNCGSVLKIWSLGCGKLFTVMGGNGNMSTWNKETRLRVDSEPHTPDRWVYYDEKLRWLPNEKYAETHTLATIRSPFVTNMQTGRSTNVCIAGGGPGFTRLEIIE